jgi:hypothetical protein
MQLPERKRVLSLFSCGFFAGFGCLHAGIVNGGPHFFQLHEIDFAYALAGFHVKLRELRLLSLHRNGFAGAFAKLFYAIGTFPDQGTFC